MESHGRVMNSNEKPPEFEFGSLTPSSPSQDSENSPADHLFFNGRLLPHVFPAPNSNITKWPISRTTSGYNSRSTSTSSRSSFGSISSSGSNCSSTSYSPRTSSFNGNNNNTNINHMPLDVKPPTSIYGETVNTKSMKGVEMVKASLYRSYSSQRWQYITPAPVKRSGGIRVGGRKKKAARIKKKTGERRGNRVMKWWRRILMAAIFACRECHALEGA